MRRRYARRVMAEISNGQTDRELRRRIERSAGQRAGYKQLVRELGLGGGRERRLLLEQLARMTARGELVKVEAEMWALPQAHPAKTARVSRDEVGSLPGERRAVGRVGGDEGLRANRDRLVAGRLDLHRDGYGFVRPNGSSDRADDLFVPPNELNGAMQGDEVLVDEAPPGRDGRRSGRVARVLTRRNPTVVGIFHYARTGRRGLERGRSAMEEAGYDARMFGGNYVTPLDERMTQPILIPEGAESAAAMGETPHRVLGEEAQVWRRSRAVGRGRVVAGWPGLADGRLLDGRDLQPTLDLRGLAKGLLAAHLGLAPAALLRAFPGSEAVGPVAGLMRA